MRPRTPLDRLEEILYAKHAIHDEEEHRKFVQSLIDLVDRGAITVSRIEHSGSAEGGIAILWRRILPIPRFGEMLHLRHHDGYIEATSDKKKWFMVFHTNTYVGFDKLNTEQIHLVITACQELIQTANTVLEMVRSSS